MNPALDFAILLRSGDPTILAQIRSAFRQQIREARAELAPLEEQCDKLRKTIEILEKAAPPIGLLCDDVLQYIFTLCLPSSHNATMLASDAPVLLTHVCAKWRKLAMATPQLWSSLHLFTHGDNDMERTFTPGTSLQERDQRVVEWIRRAQSCKLSLSFGGAYRSHRSSHCLLISPDGRDMRPKEYVPNDNARDLKRLLLLLLPYIAQWDDIAIVLSGPRKDVERFFLQKALRWKKLGPLFSVRRFGLWLEFDGAVGAMEKSLPKVIKTLGLDQAPHLRELGIYSNGRLNPNNFDYDPDPVPNKLPIDSLIPWSHLRRLNLQVPLAVSSSNFTPGLAFRPRDILDILGQCPDLVAFAANVLQNNRPEPITPRPTNVNERLETVSLFFKYDGVPQDKEDSGLPVDWVSHCRWPSISSLKLNYNVSSTSSVTGFIQKIGETLTSLSLDACYAIDLEILYSLPALVQLSLETRQPLHECWNDAFEQSEYLLENLTPHGDGDGDDDNDEDNGNNENSDDDDDEDDDYEPLERGSAKCDYCCPLLQYLKWERTATFDDEIFKNFLYRRASSDTPMKQVHIEFGRRAQSDLLLECGDLIQQGPDLKVSYWTEEDDEPEWKRGTSVHGLVAKTGVLPTRHFGDDLGWD